MSFSWDHLIIIVLVVSVAAACFRYREPHRKKKTDE